MLAPVDRLAHVVQEGCQQQLLIVGQPFACQLEDLQAVVEHVALGVRFGRLYDVFQRQQQKLIGAEAIGRICAGVSHSARGLIGMYFCQKPLALGPIAPGNRLDAGANLAVAGQVVGADFAAHQPPGRLHLRPRVLGFLVGEDQLGGLERHAATQTIKRHLRMRRNQAHQCGAGQQSLDQHCYSTGKRRCKPARGSGATLDHRPTIA